MRSNSSWLTTRDGWSEPISTRTHQAYAANVRRFCGWLAAARAPLTEIHARDYALRDYKTYLKTVGRSAASSVNLALAAVDHFYRFLGLGPAKVRREQLPAQAPHALDADEQRRLLRAAERTPGGAEPSHRPSAVLRRAAPEGMRCTRPQ